MAKKIPLFIILLLVVGLGCLACGLWIPAKALVAQALLNRAWTESMATGRDVKPWPWADMVPVARLTLDRLAIDMVVLAGTSGETLAFGPGLHPQSSSPGRNGHKILFGHRDTSFAFLKDVVDGDAISLESQSGRKLYRVVQRRTINADDLYFNLSENGLSLVTCYPFNAVLPHTAERFVVMAVADSVDSG